ncbi:MAG: histidine kinase [Prolixibacteraceae bacterium]|jgi:sensor histidine kinase YesM|nr:histidine kinase [Prolixibacteraceae bacterium]MDI9564783.1 histidine kinase [Bacteroidota bacterium]NLS99439.1 histidine kinase [Bacteroidales bacterium]HNZ68692.1 histidine kinase [Prolixibacteraceae bacterium]HOC87689.1 histidine kinase [Prolixibacteraceae bacterium]
MVKRVLLSVWFLGLLLALPVIFQLPEFFAKYKIRQVLQETTAQPEDYRIYFRDLNNDGKRQKVYSFRNQAGQLAFQYFGDEGGLINQINFSRKYSPNVPWVYFGDANNNGMLEIYGFSLGRDSLFLNWAEPYGPDAGPDRTESLFITRIGVFDVNKLDFTVTRFNVLDLDLDGQREILFSLVTGYSEYPRMLVKINPETLEITTSDDLGINPYIPVYHDLDKDMKLEIIVGSNAYQNLEDSPGDGIIYSRPYLLAYDSDLKPIWPPLPFSPGIDNTLHVLFNPSDMREIVVFQFNRSLPTDRMIGIFRVDYNGNVKDSTFLPEYGKRFKFQVFDGGDFFWLYTGDKMVMINPYLKVIGEKDIDVSAKMYRSRDFEEGFPHIATSDLQSLKVCIYTDYFNHKVEKVFKDEKIRNIIMEVAMGPEYFMIQTDSNEYTYRFGKNRLYYLKFPAFLAIYLLSVLFVWLIMRIREKQLTEWYDLQNQVRDLEIKSIRMQMDPHFMFNAFNSMALLLKNGERDEAFNAFMKFTRMVRLNFDFSDQITRPLSEELEIVRQYLDLNKLRFKDNLEFSVHVAGDVPMSVPVPKMMLQIHVENALKHGLARLETTGKLDLSIVKSGNEIRVSIEDNGIGRQKAAQLNTGSTRQGLKMLQAMYDRLNQQGKPKIFQEIEDLLDENQKPAGTRVNIRIPFTGKDPAVARA